MPAEPANPDLPDVAPAAAAAAAAPDPKPQRTDDLLAQLAGDEIDRLLADAEKHAPPLDVPLNPSTDPAPDPTPDETDVVAAAAEVAAAETSAVAAALANPATAATAPAPSAPANTDPPPKKKPTPRPAGEALRPDDPLAGQLDSLFDELTKADTEPPAAPAPSAINTPPESPATATATDVQPPTDPDAATSAAEPDGLIAGLTDDQSPDPTADPAGLTDASDAALAAAIDDVLGTARPGRRRRRTPRDLPTFVLKPLVWLNAPFASLPDALRDALGKVGLVTLANAVALLAYIHFFRKH